MKEIPKLNFSQDRHRVMVIFSILIASIFFTMHCGKKEEPFPKMLLGKWTTDSERYQDRYIEFDHELMIFGTGEEPPNIFFIRSVERKQTESGNEYTLMCTNKVDTEFIFELLIEDDGGVLTLRLKNPREVVWKKEIETKE